MRRLMWTRYVYKRRALYAKLLANSRIQGKQGEDHLLDLIRSQSKSSKKTDNATKTPPGKAPASTPAKPDAKK